MVSLVAAPFDWRLFETGGIALLVSARAVSATKAVLLVFLKPTRCASKRRPHLANPEAQHLCGDHVDHFTSN
jgi:hypothetical protein